MAYTDWSTTASLNVTIDGVNIDENCPPANLNNAVRSVMAGVASLRDAVPTVSGFMPVTGGTFSGTQPIFSGEGAFLHHASSSLASGKVHVLAEGSADPAGLANGDLIFYYTP